MIQRKNSLRIAGIIIIALNALSFLFCSTQATIDDLKGSVQNLGIFGESRIKSVVGQDGCTPIRIGNMMMWTFGDTILGSWKGEVTVNSTFEEAALMKGMLSNSLAFTGMPDDNNVRNLEFTFYREQSAVVQFIKPYPGEDPSVWRFWAIDGIEIDRTVYVYYIIVHIEKKDNSENRAEYPIRIMGVGIAEWHKPAAWKPGDPMHFTRSPLIFTEGEPVFGDAVVRRDDYLFVIGHGPASKTRVPAYVARVRIPSIKTRSRYEFLDSAGHWTRALVKAAPVMDDVMGEPSLSHNEILDKFIILYCSLDGKIKTVLFESFETIKNKKTAVIYIPPSLPAIASRRNLHYYSGKEIFSTSRAVYAIYIHPAIYQPILLRIPYSSFQYSAQ